MTSYVERSGLAIVGQKRNGDPVSDFENRKIATRIWPKATGGPFEVRVGTQEIQGGAITYDTAQTFTPGTDQYLDTCVSGRLIAVSVSNPRAMLTGNSTVTISNYRFWERSSDTSHIIAIYTLLPPPPD